MMTLLKSGQFKNSFWMRAASVLLVLLVLFSFAALLFHHHEDGEEHASCAVCRIVQQVVSGFLLSFCFFIFFQAKVKNFISREIQNFYSFLASSSLSGRAPPVSL